MRRINHQDLIDDLTAYTGIPKETIAIVLAALAEKIKMYILAGDEVIVKNLAKFFLREAAGKRLWFVREKQFASVSSRLLPKAIFSRSIIDSVKAKK